MRKAVAGEVVGGVLLVVCWLAPGRAAAGDGPEIRPALTLDCLSRMSWPELEAIYRGSAAGSIPQGFTRGRAIYCPESRAAGVRSKVTNFVWRG
jgi:hypothetical protein